MEEVPGGETGAPSGNERGGRSGQTSGDKSGYCRLSRGLQVRSIMIKKDHSGAQWAKDTLIKKVRETESFVLVPFTM